MVSSARHLLVGIASCVLLTSIPTWATDTASPNKVSPSVSMPNESVGDGSLMFTKNMGQWPDSILYRTEAGGATLWLTKNGIWYQFSRRETISGDSATITDAVVSGHALLNRDGTASRSIVTMVKAEFVDANPNVEVVGTGETTTKCNFYMGDNPSRSFAGVSNYGVVTMHELYRGVDVRYRERDGRLMAEVQFSSSAKPAQVKVAFRGDVRAVSESAGLTLVETPEGLHQFSGFLLTDVSEASLVGPRMADGAFASSANVDLIWGTYLGSTGDDAVALDIALDANANVYVAGRTNAATFPGALFQGSAASEDAYVFKLSESGSTLYWYSYICGPTEDGAEGVAVSSSGEVVIVGQCKAGYPNTLGSGHHGPTDGFVTVLNSNGTHNRSRRLGGDWLDGAYDVTLSGSDVYLTGQSQSGPEFGYSPCACVPGDTAGYVFVARIDESLSFGPSYIRRFIHPYWAFGLAVAVDDDGEIFVTGYGALDSAFLENEFLQTPNWSPGYNHSFVARYDPSSPSNQPLFGTYLGGNGGDMGEAIAVEGPTKYVYVAGETGSSDWTLAGTPIRSSKVGGPNLFLTKIDADASSPALLYNSYWGGGELPDLALDRNTGHLYLTGMVVATSFPIGNAFQPNHFAGTWDSFLAKIDVTDMDTMVYSTYLGGGGGGRGVAYSSLTDAAYVTGTTGAGFPTTVGSYNPSVVKNVYVAKLFYDTDVDDDGIDNGSDNCPDVSNADQLDTDNDDIGDVCDADLDGDGVANASDNCEFVNNDQSNADGDLSGDACDNCPETVNDGQEDTNLNDIGDACESPYTLKIMAFSPIDLVIRDPKGDSIGIGFNTIGLGSSYDTLADVNSELLTGPDGDKDDSVTVPVPMAGRYVIRMVPEPGALGSDKFTLALRVNGNQLLIPENLSNASVSSIGTAFPDSVVYNVRTTLTGDCNASGNFTSADIILLVNYIFKSQAQCQEGCHGDANCSRTITSADIIVMVNFIFKSGSPPCSQSAGAPCL